MTEKKEYKISYEISTDFDTLSSEDKQLLAAAENHLQYSYSPYSNYKVACALLLANGEIICGANQENAAYPMCVCAEVTALNACNAKYPTTAIYKMAITVQSPSGEILDPAAPCGQCRQTILEYENRFEQPIEIILFQKNKKIVRFSTIKSLLPFYFSGKDLKIG